MRQDRGTGVNVLPYSADRHDTGDEVGKTLGEMVIPIQTRIENGHVEMGNLHANHTLSATHLNASQV
jgi:hypothetical protein